MAAYRIVATSAVQEDAAGEHRDRVQEHEPHPGAGTAGEVHEAGDDQQVQDHLEVDERLQAAQQAECQDVRDGERVRPRDEEVERVDGEQRLGDRLDVDGDQQQGGDHHHPEQHQALQLVLEPQVPHALAGRRRAVSSAC
jgi:hypothetical protein